MAARQPPDHVHILTTHNNKHEILNIKELLVLQPRLLKGLRFIARYKQNAYSAWYMQNKRDKIY